MVIPLGKRNASSVPEKHLPLFFLTQKGVQRHRPVRAVGTRDVLQKEAAGLCPEHGALLPGPWGEGAWAGSGGSSELLRPTSPTQQRRRNGTFLGAWALKLAVLFFRVPLLFISRKHPNAARKPTLGTERKESPSLGNNYGPFSLVTGG